MTNWLKKAVSTAQCSPALLILGVFAVFMYVCWRYYAVIIQTIVIAGIAIASVGIGTFIGWAVLTAYRRSHQDREVMPPSELEIEADILEQSDTEVRWTEDGSLEVTRKPD